VGKGEKRGGRKSECRSWQNRKRAKSYDELETIKKEDHQKNVHLLN